MVLRWNNEKYQKVDTAVSIVLLTSIVAFMLVWYFNALSNSMLMVTVLPIGLAHWYKRKLEKLLKVYGGAQVTVESNKLILSKPEQNYEATIKFREITSVNSTHWLFLDKMKLSLKGNREIELVNICDQKSILDKISTSHGK